MRWQSVGVSLRGVIEKLSKAGFTFEAWHRWGCPTFAENT